MPEIDKEAKRRLEDSFWAHLAARYPLTRWWWGAESGTFGTLFPEWTAAAFEHEAAEWRRLAQDTVMLADMETSHWGRFARTVATRVQAGSFRDGAEPLRYANMALTVVNLLDPRAERHPRGELLESLAGWLSQVSDVAAAGFWRRTRASAEASRMIHQVSRMPCPEGTVEDAWKLLQENVVAMVKAYLKRLAQAPQEDEEAIPWAVSAHVSVDVWRDRREEMSLEAPLVIKRPVPSEQILGVSLPHAASVQDVVVPGLMQWWVRPTERGDVVFHGDSYDPSVALATVLALWRNESPVTDLTWALSHPPFVEGGLITVCDLMHRLWPTWAPVQSGYLAQWLQRRRAMATADAWLWLEGGDPSEVYPWLARFMTKGESLALIPWMKSHPGYYVMSHRVFEVLSATAESEDWAHWVFRHGPVVPDAVFLAPAGPTP